jgi:hypothetical protein
VPATPIPDITERLGIFKLLCRFLSCGLHQPRQPINRPRRAYVIGGVLVAVGVKVVYSSFIEYLFERPRLS